MTPEQYEHAREACQALLPWLLLIATSLIVCRVIPHWMRQRRSK